MLKISSTPRGTWRENEASADLNIPSATANSSFRAPRRRKLFTSVLEARRGLMRAPCCFVQRTRLAPELPGRCAPRSRPGCAIRSATSTSETPPHLNKKQNTNDTRRRRPGDGRFEREEYDVYNLIRRFSTSGSHDGREVEGERSWRYDVFAKYRVRAPPSGCTSALHRMSGLLRGLVHITMFDGPGCARTQERHWRTELEAAR